MSRRKYTHIQELEEEILSMRRKCATRQEIADPLGLSKSQIKNWINRYNRKQAKLKARIFPRPKGRRRKSDVLRDIVAEQAYEIRCLRTENELLRDFHAETPNSKWVTDISYIHTRQGVLYLSTIRDLYDNSIVAYKTGAAQSVNLVLDTIHLAMRIEKKKVAAELQLHSGQGFPYTSQAYFKLTQQYGTRLRCQDVGTRMRMQWRKISSPFSKQSASTATNRPPFQKSMR